MFDLRGPCVTPAFNAGDSSLVVVTIFSVPTMCYAKMFKCAFHVF